ncbi:MULTISPECIES: hypothetical protein [Nostoc]|uniref:hypothetical protein n=1 Tax=Nostoc TaxID=1177 RepID=UPI0018F03081|nr:MULTISPECIES: hypothetical protein [Nostoc]
MRQRQALQCLRVARSLHQARVELAIRNAATNPGRSHPGIAKEAARVRGSRLTAPCLFLPYRCARRLP